MAEPTDIPKISVIVADNCRVLNAGKILEPGDEFELDAENAKTLCDEGVCEYPSSSGKKADAADSGSQSQPLSDDELLAEAVKRGLIEQPPVPYEDQTVEELQSQVEDRQLEVEGSGKDGNVVKADLVAALEKADAADSDPAAQ